MRIDLMFIQPLGRVVSRLLYKPVFVGKLPKKGGLVLAINHQTDVDAFLVMDLATRCRRRCRFLAKSELFKNPFLGAVMRGCRHIPVLRGTSRASEALAPAIKAAKLGECVAIFPEGAVTHDPAYWPMSARRGAGVVALSAGVPLVPVLIEGSYKVRPSGWGGLFNIRWRKLRTPVLIKVLDPVDISDLSGPEDGKVATERAMAQIRSELEKVRKTPAPAHIWDTRVDGRTWFW